MPLFIFVHLARFAKQSRRESGSHFTHIGWAARNTSAEPLQNDMLPERVAFGQVV